MIKEFPDKILLIKDDVIEDYWVLKNLTQCEDAEYIRKDIVDEMLNHAYLAGQEAMREQMIEKAVEWLKAYIHYDDFGGNMEWLVPFANDDEMVENFKKFMED